MNGSTATLEPDAGPAVGLAGLDAAVRVWCRSFDPEVLLGSESVAAVETLAGMIRRLTAAQARAARRAERCRAYAGRARTAGQWLALQNGISQGEALRALETTRRLEDCPETAEAFAAGELSLPEADAVTAAAVLDPTAESKLVAQATGTHDLKALRHRSDEVRNAARSTEDDAARHLRLRSGRRWRQYAGSEGHLGVDGRFAPLDFVHANAVLDAFTRAQGEQARLDGRTERTDALRADAFIAAMHAAGTTIGVTPSPAAEPTEPTQPTQPAEPAIAAPAAAPPDADAATTPAVSVPVAATPGAAMATAGGVFDLIPSSMHVDVVVLIDAIALKRGWSTPGERCEIIGAGPIPVAWAKQLMRDHELHLLLHDQTDIRAYASATRHRPKPLDLALAVRDRDCNAGTCTATPTEIDHTIDYTLTHRTALDELGGLCRHSHDQKTHRGGTLARSSTHWYWWPPGVDPATTPPQAKPVGRHLNAWNLDHPPGHDPPGEPDGDAVALPFDSS